jgi:hypothetical protein
LFKVTQHERDRILLSRIQSVLDCGSISSVGRNALELRVYGLSKITDKIVPFFSQHPLHGAKALDFRDFCKGIEIMNNGDHLTEAGLQQLKELYDGMNSTRTKFE